MSIRLSSGNWREGYIAPSPSDAGRPVSAALTPGGLASAGPPLVLSAEEPPHWDAEAGKHVSTVQHVILAQQYRRDPGPVYGNVGVVRVAHPDRSRAMT